VTLMCDFNDQEVTAVAVVTNHEDRYAPCDVEEDYILAKVHRFKATQEIYDAGGDDE
jgi:cytochrome c-type biogenesis protein CcmE